MKLNGIFQFLAPIMLTGLSLLALTNGERRLDDFTQEIGVRDDYSSGYRSMRLLGKFKRTKSQSYAPAKAHRHPAPQYSSPQHYSPSNPQYGPPHAPITPTKTHYGPPQYGPPQYGPPQYGPPKPEYGSPKPQYGSPKPEYGPPKSEYGPPKPQYGPPKHEYGSPKPQYGPPKHEYGPPKPNYRAPSHAYGPPQQGYRPASSAYARPQQNYAAAAIYSPPQQVYVQPSPPYVPTRSPYSQLPVAPVAVFNPPPYSVTEKPLPPTDFNQPVLTLQHGLPDDDRSSESNDDSKGSSDDSKGSSDDSSSDTSPEPSDDNSDPVEPKPSEDVSENSVGDQVEAEPEETSNQPENHDVPKQTEFISSIPNYDSVKERDNNQQEADDSSKVTEAPEPSFLENKNFDIPTISPPISTNEALTYSPNFSDNNDFSESPDFKFPSIFNPPSTFYKKPEKGAEENKDSNDFGFFQLGIFPKTSSFFEQNYNG